MALKTAWLSQESKTVACGEMWFLNYDFNLEKQDSYIIHFKNHLEKV